MKRLLLIAALAASSLLPVEHTLAAQSTSQLTFRGTTVLSQ